MNGLNDCGKQRVHAVKDGKIVEHFDRHIYYQYVEHRYLVTYHKTWMQCKKINGRWIVEVLDIQAQS